MSLPHKMLMAITVAVAGTVAMMAPAQAASAIRDQGNFFSASARDDVLKKLQSLEQKTGYEVQVETYATLPEPWHGQLSGGDRGKVFHDFAVDRGQLHHAHGLFVMIVRDPAHLEVDADSRIRSAGYTADERKSLADMLLAKFRAKDYDGALNELATKAGDQFSRLPHRDAATPAATPNHAVNNNHAANNVPPAAPRHGGNAPQAAPQGSSWTGLLLIGGLILGVIILIRAFSSMSGGSSGYGGQGYGNNVPPGGYPQGGYTPGPQYGGRPGWGGGGFMSGLFGGMAGSWLYDSMFNRSHGSGNAWTSHDDDWNHRGGGMMGGGGDSGFTGGDFGDSGGGGDFGGGDFGGGSDSYSGGDF